MAESLLARGTLIVLLAILPHGGLASEPTDDLTLLDLEDLMEIEVTSVSKKAQSVGDTASAIHVLTGEEIRESGYTTIADALRLVPGVSVARINADKWAIGVRGGQQLFSNKLLVLIDGRSVYWSLYSGVNWAMQDLVLEDIDRIEVIRGPGASVWGANAVNGVINIITKKPAETQDTLATLLAGTNGEYIGELRQGGSVGEDGHYRVYAKARRFGELKPQPGERLDDSMKDARIGFRADASKDDDGFSFQGQIANLVVEETFANPVLTAPYTAVSQDDARITQGFLLGKWNRTLAADSEVNIQAYADSMHINDYLAPTERARYSTLDVELNHNFMVGETHGIIWGMGYRGNLTDLRTRGAVDLDVDKLDNVFSAFLHDDITIIPEHLTASVGIKLERNDFTGIEIQPTARAIYRFDNGHSLWGAVSRAVRTPSRLDTDLNARLRVIPPSATVPLPTQLRIQQNDDVNSEELWAFEAGYRAQVGDALNIDIAGFANYYDKLVGLSQISSNLAGPPLHVDLLERFDNNIEGESFGGEFSIDWRPTAATRLRSGYSLAHISLHVTDGTNEDLALLPAFEDNLAKHQLFAHLTHRFSDAFEAGIVGRLVDDIEFPDVDAYAELDLRLGYQPREGVELSLIGRNLLHDEHKEHGTEFPSAVTGRVERSVLGQLSVTF